MIIVLVDFRLARSTLQLLPLTLPALPTLPFHTPSPLQSFDLTKHLVTQPYHPIVLHTAVV